MARRATQGGNPLAHGIRTGEGCRSSFAWCPNVQFSGGF